MDVSGFKVHSSESVCDPQSLTCVKKPTQLSGKLTGVVC